MYNTFGLHAVNRTTFNQKLNEPLCYPKEIRDLLVTVMKTSNLALHIMDFLPSVSFISGVSRIAFGSLMIGVTLAIGERDAQQGAIIGRYYDEALTTGAAQIARGALVLTGPIGKITNLALDALATVQNLTTVGDYRTYPLGTSIQPHREPAYPFPLQALHLG